MGFFSLGAGKEKGDQLHFYADGSFEFRKKPLEDGCIVERVEDQVLKAWPYFYSAQMQFDGYKSIPASMPILSFDRDMILDPFNKIPQSETVNGKPDKNDVNVKKWLSQLAESMRYKVMSKPGSMLLVDKITVFLGVALLMEIIGVFTMAATR
jgi:hypothetical protein